MHWMILPLKRYAEFSGRSRRMEYWMFALLNFIVVCAFMFLTGGFAALSDPYQLADPRGVSDPIGAANALFFGGMGIILLIYALAILIPSIAVTIRRLHDRNMSGWWYLGAIVGSMVPVVGFLVSLAFLVLMALPGTPGPNRFGPDPKGEGAAETYA